MPKDGTLILVTWRLVIELDSRHRHNLIVNMMLQIGRVDSICVGAHSHGAYKMKSFSSHLVNIFFTSSRTRLLPLHLQTIL